MQRKDQLNSENRTDKKKGIDRRKFIRYSAAAGVGFIALATGGKKIPHLFNTMPVQTNQKINLASDTHKVVVVKSKTLFSDGQQPEKAQIRNMLDAGIKRLSGENDPLKAWRNLFSPDDVVGIKVNCIAGANLSSHPYVVDAIVAELQKIQVPAKNIIIWDRTGRELQNAGYKLNTEDPGVKCYGTDTLGYEENASVKNSFNGRLSKILTQKITALINVPILKNHGGAGVSIALKNHYGSFHNPGEHHGNMCDPYIADLNALDEIKGKTKLIVCDATRATCNGGPGYNPAFVWQYSGLLVSTDPVALDTVGTSIIEERRAETNLPTLEESGRYPRCLASAAERGLGSAKIDQIERSLLTV